MTSEPSGLDEGLKAYLGAVVETCERASGAPLVAAWAVGSLTTHDFEPGRSDLDVLAIFANPLQMDQKRQLTRELRHAVMPCPTYGLDFVAYNGDAVRQVPRTPEYEVSISTGAHWDDDVSLGGPYAGGLIDLAVARQCGLVVHGRSPLECVGPIPRAWVLQELAEAVRWHVDQIHDPFHDPTGSNAVLNACRALAYLAGERFVSKTAGAAWLTASRSVPVVEEAISIRRQRRTRPLERESVAAFLEEAIDAFAGQQDVDRREEGP